MPCTLPLLDPAMVKWFDDQHKATGYHNWTCHNCMVAYHKMNVRICRMEKRIDSMDQKISENTATNLATSDKVDKVDKEVTVIKETIRSTKKDAVNEATKAWSAELREREGRKTTILVFGLQEPSLDITSGVERRDEDKREARAMFSDMCAVVEDTDIKFEARMGPLTPEVADNPRPLKISFRTTEVREQVFNKARNLPKTRFKMISIVPDTTKMQRDEDKELMDEADRLNNERSEEEALNWVYRCTGKKGERLICKLKIRNQDRQQNRQGQKGQSTSGPQANFSRTSRPRRTSMTEDTLRTETQTTRTETDTDESDMDSSDKEDQAGRSKRQRGASSEETSPRQVKKTKQRKQNH